MKLIRKYISREFWTLFLFSITSLTLIILASKVFEDLKMLIEYKAQLLVIAEYYLYELPFIILQVCPASVILATLYSLSKLVKNNEITAMKSAGITTRQIVTPIVISAFLISIGIMLFQELVVPFANHQTRVVEQLKIKKNSSMPGIARFDLAFRTSNNYFIYARYLDGTIGRMDTPTIIKLNKNNLIEKRIDAIECRYSENAEWILYNGYLRTFSYNYISNEEKSGVSKKTKEFINIKLNIAEKAEKFHAMKLDIIETPAALLKEYKNIKELNMILLLEQIDKLKKSGLKFNEELVNFYVKTAFPFSNLILCLIGIPFALIAGKRAGAITSFAISLAVGFVYYGFIALGISFGKNEVIAPFLSAWIGNIIFIFVAVYMFYLARK